MQLALQLAIAGKTSGVEVRFLNGATGLGLMRAVTKFTTRGERGDLGEGVVDVFGVGPELELAQTGKIHEQPATGHADELAMCGGVTALVVGLADESCA